MTDGQAEELAAFDRLHPVVRYHVANTLGWPGLRPLQVHATEPVLRGDDCLLVAPTAGGKTEAAVLPLLSRMAHEEWSGVSVLYVCPLKALLNNLEPRLSRYASWVGRTASVRHGDTPAGARARQLSDRPSILMTTPESLEALLVSSTVDAHRFLRDARAVVVDEVHAFAGDDRGWHLLALLERVEAITGRPVQRIGLSATVGNPAGLLTWLQGPPARRRPRSVVTPSGGAAGVPELALDFVGSVGNASRVVRALHPGAKRLVFTDSRRVAESLAVHLQEEGTEAFVSHSSLSLEERRRSEAAFAEGRDCVIVSTSTLELGVDVGDLDHVLQVGAPLTVASVLQRLGRTGRRPGTRRNTTFLATDDGELLRATALLLLHSEGYVEPVVPPPAPRHIAAQQMLALTLERGRVDPRVDFSWLGELGHLAPDELDHAVRWLLDSGHLDRDGGLVHVGPEAEERFGRAFAAEGLDVPILGSNPVFAPGLLAGPAANWLKTHLYVASPVSSFDEHPDLLEQYKEAYPEATVSLGVVVGFGMSELMKQVLDAACENGDLTRQGVVDAFDQLEEVDTGGLVVPIRGFELGKSPSLESFVLQPADVEGGATVAADAFQGQFAEAIAG